MNLEESLVGPGDRDDILYEHSKERLKSIFEEFSGNVTENEFITITGFFAYASLLQLGSMLSKKEFHNALLQITQDVIKDARDLNGQEVEH